MNQLRKYFAKQFVLLFLTCISLAGCKVGEDDPFISLRSRDARLKANWKLQTMENHYEIRTLTPGSVPAVTTIHASFNGYDLNVRTTINGALISDSTFGYNYQLKIKDDGELSYENTVIQNMIGVKSTGEDYWYWLDTDKKKARVHVGNALLFPATAGLQNLSSNAILPQAGLFNDFTVEGLRNKELQLTHDKMLELITIAGFQQITVSSHMTFNSK